MKRLFSASTSRSHHNSVRLACVRHAASVHPEPGSNSQLKVFVLNPDQHLVDPIRLSDLISDDLLLGLLSLVFDYF